MIKHFFCLVMAVSVIATVNLLSAQKRLTVSGHVKNALGAPLENAQVIFNGVPTVQTNPEGKFQFEYEVVDDSLTNSHTLVISYPDLTTAIRSFHHNMQSTSFDIILEDKCCSSLKNYLARKRIEIMPVPVLPLSLSFEKTKDIRLSREDKKLLSGYANNMRNNPFNNFYLTGNGSTLREIHMVKTRQQAIIQYLSDEEGIPEEKFIRVINNKTSDNKIVISMQERDNYK